eukprot:763658-Hanusia_phi.AAC.9
MLARQSRHVNLQLFLSGKLVYVQSELEASCKHTCSSHRFFAIVYSLLQSRLSSSRAISASLARMVDLAASERES